LKRTSKTKAEEKSIGMKILNYKDDTYDFEFGW
jgi:hypothetical protein